MPRASWQEMTGVGKKKFRFQKKISFSFELKARTSCHGISLRGHGKATLASE
jgi:hypothetical protein